MVTNSLTDAETKMRKAVDVLQRELGGIRSGRASPALVERLRVEYYGAPTPLTQLATVSAPEARLLIIQPWDKTILSSVEKAILKSDLGLNPTNDGNIIRLVIPPLSEERRKEMVKLVKTRVEECRITLRNIRRDVLETLRQLEKAKQISQDEQKRAQDQLQKLLDSFIVEANRVGETKEKELMEN